MTRNERRTHARFPLVLAVDYPGTAEAVRDYTENLSESGLFVRTERTFAAGERVTLVLSFPDLLPASELEVEVVRLRPEGSQGPAGVAVRVPEGSEDSRRKLRELVRAAEHAERAEHPYRVLLVEDNSLVAAMYTSALRRLSTREGLAGLVVELAGDGNEALQRLHRPPAIDLVITDVYMPIMSGFALVERIRAEPRLAATPVIVITSGNNMERQRAMRLGVRFFLQKPVKYQDIVATVRTLLTAAASRASQGGADPGRD